MREKFDILCCDLSLLAMSNLTRVSLTSGEVESFLNPGLLAAYGRY